MNLKSKITLDFLAVLLVMLGIGGYSFVSLRQLDRSAANILKDNFYSVQLGQQLYAALDQLVPAQQQRYLTATPPAGYDATVQRSLRQFQQSLTREAGNLTEPGERAVVDSLSRTFRAYQQALDNPIGAQPTADVYFNRVLPLHQQLRAQTHRMVQLNMIALTHKNEASAHTATLAMRYTLLMLALSAVIAVFFMMHVPDSVVKPVSQLLASLKKANKQDFTSTILVHRKDELGQVAQAFNLLLEQLRDYRTSTVAQFKAERNRLASVVNALDEGLLVVDESRRILVANPVISRLLRIPVEKLAGRAADELAQENELFRKLLHYYDVPAAERTPENSVLTLTQEGETEYYRLLTNEVYQPQLTEPAHLGSVLTLRNVSEDKKLDQIKWRFLASVAQELQSPLSSMTLSLNRLQDSKAGPLTPEQHNMVYTLTRENKHLLKLVGELLDVSRLELGTIQLNFQPVQLHTLVKFAVDTIRPQLLPKRLVLDVQVPTALPAVRADIEKTTWVLLSLLANAIRYAQMQDTLHLRASMSVNGQQVQVSVQDQGPGIPVENQEKIFHRFTQIPSQGGSGLGLSIAREFMASQGGHLWVESTVGAGSTFLFTLPVA